MKIFKSLNCIVCEAPFTPTANQPRSPRHLVCGKTMCHECFEREKSTANEERKHRCWIGDICFSSPNFAYFLIDVLYQDSLKLSPMGHGYLLCKPFNMPKCPVCHDEYSITLGGRSPFLLQWCKHIICTSCYENTRHLNEQSDKDRLKYEIKCPICSVITGTNAEKLEGHRLDDNHSEIIDFLTELPEMTRQLEEVNMTACRFCKECKREQPVEDIFYCEECQKNICGTCGFKKHRSHKARAILEMEATKISEELQEVSIKEINTYLELPKELVRDIETFRTKLLSKEENLKQASNYEDLQKEHEKCIQLKTYFKLICEGSLEAYLRECSTKVKDLVTSLDDDIN